MTGFLVIVIALGWVVSQVYGNVGILYAAVAFSLVMNVTAYWFSDKIALSSTGAKEADAKQYLEVHRILENLAITSIETKGPKTGTFNLKESHFSLPALEFMYL